MTLRNFIGPVLAVALMALDQVSKWFVLEHIFRPALNLGDPARFESWLHNAPERLPDISIPYLPVFNLTMTWNFGISFGLMQGWGLLLLLGILAIVSGFAAWMITSRVLPEICALALIVGGALGNVLDRVRFGAVADFLDFHWKAAHFFVFNPADAAISLGVALLLLHGLFFAKNEA